MARGYVRSFALFILTVLVTAWHSTIVIAEEVAAPVPVPGVYIQEEENGGYDDQYSEEEDLEYVEDLEEDVNEGEDVNEEENSVYQYTEEERLAEYHKRGYQWPIPDDVFTPNTTGWIQMMKNRLTQVGRIEDNVDRYEGYIQTVTTGFVVKNHTEHGFGIARCADEELMEELRMAVRSGIPTAQLEGEDAVIPGPNPPLLVSNRPDLLQRIVTELQPYAETWSGMELLPYGAYGFRVYRNESQLYMHIDRPQTHVISFIMHIDSSEDSDPWPLFIEDFYGQTHEVTLTSGDILFYESCKILHGRPKALNGSWYSSVFVHYYPMEGWADRNMENEAHFAVPPIWPDQIPKLEEDNLPKLEMVETSLVERDCPNHWCATKNSIKWGGPGELGVWIAPTQERYPFHPPPYKPIELEEL